MIETTANIPEKPVEPIAADYDESSIETLEWREHIRLRPGMYIGTLGDGSNSDDGIYVLFKEVVDNSIDEHMMGFGNRVVVEMTETQVSVRDYGRGIPLGKLVDAVGNNFTGGKYKSAAFQKSVGQNGVGLKAVNALSTEFVVRAYRAGQMKEARFSRGELIEETDLMPTDEPDGTFVAFTPDPSIFRNYRFREEIVTTMLKNYSFLNVGLAMIINGHKYVSKEGLLDLLNDNMSHEPLYPPIRLRGENVEIVFTHVNQYGEEYYSFVNTQYTSEGGPHLAALKESVARTIKDYFGKNFEFSDIRSGIVAALSIRIDEPVFKSQTKTKLGSEHMEPGGVTINKYVGDFVKKELDNYLHRELGVADVILKKVQQSEKERKAMSGVTKLAREKAKKINLNNSNLLDCNIHLSDAKGNENKRLESSIFITEGKSAAGSISKIRDVHTQAVFTLRGKPKNSFGQTLKVVYQNDEFNLLQAALNIEDGLEGLRYNKVIIATDADVDGMHIRLLLLTFFLQFFPDLIKKGHVYVLQTPLFRVRNKKNAKRGSKHNDDTIYCYSDEERLAAVARFGENAEITRFKGLGEISPEEFVGFIGENMRLDRVKLQKDDAVPDVLRFYMGANTPQRKAFIIDNLIIEDDSQIS